MAFQKKYLDLVFVSGGLLIMFSYNLFYLYRCCTGSKSTDLYFENRDKEKWVKKFIEDTTLDIRAAIEVIGYNIAAATQLAIISLTLCALIGAWTTYSSKNFFQGFIYGDTSQSTISIKSICLLTCFLLAFSGFVQSVRYLNYANYLMSTRGSGKDSFKALVKKIRRAGECWLFGLRALYFALIFLLWFFGPIPMFVTSFILVIILYFHDTDTRDLDNVEDDQQANA